MGDRTQYLPVASHDTIKTWWRRKEPFHLEWMMGMGVNRTMGPTAEGTMEAVENR